MPLPWISRCHGVVGRGMCRLHLRMWVDFYSNVSRHRYDKLVEPNPDPMFFPALVVTSGVAVTALVRAYRESGDGLAAAWAATHGLTLTTENRPVVAWYLRAARVLRTWGAVGGVLVPAFLALAWSGHLEVVGVDTAGGVNPGDASWIFVGYLVGALYAELALVRPVDPARRSASLVPRELDDYLPRSLLRAQRGLAAAAALGALLALALPYEDPPRPTSVVVVGYALYVVGFAAILERLQRWVVRRPQPFTAESLVAADDAIRAQAVHSLAGAGMALLLFQVAATSMLLAMADVAVLRWTMWIPAVVAFVLAVGACQRYGHRPWRVRRFPTAPAPPVSA